MTNDKLKYFIPVLFFSILCWSEEISAHGSKIEYQKTEAIEIKATYSSGEPMANAQVVVYAPGDRSVPWMTGKTDERGYFTFTPNGSHPGNWDVKIRQAGHGRIISIPLGEETLASVSKKSETLALAPETVLTQSEWSTNSNQYSSIQKALMTASGVWGFIGTALFFSRKKEQH